jgi:hypothetical protein
VWETELSPELGYPGFTGQAAVVSTQDGSSVGIGISGAEPGAHHTWRVRLGSCATPGQQIGLDADYPELVVDNAGAASAEVFFGPRLTIGNAYHVEVRVSAADPSRVACGDLVAR